MQVGDNIDRTQDDIRSLKACVNDLISLLALPAIWSGSEPDQIVGALLDVLLSMLQLDFAAAFVSDSGSDVGSPIIRLAQSRNPFLSVETLAQKLTPWLLEDSDLRPRTLALRGDDFSLAPIRFGLKQGLGLMVAGSRRNDFPNSTEKLLLRVAANQAAISLQDARILQQQKEIARRLDRTVAQTQAQLSRASRVATAAQLSASIAHEINQPLSAIVTNTNAAVHWLTEDPPNIVKVRKVLESIVRDGKGAAEVVQRVRTLFSGAVPQRTRFDLDQLIHETIGIVHLDANAREISIETELERAQPFVVADRVQVQQVMLNVIINAIEAMENVADRAKRIIIRSRLQSSCVLVEITDNGLGIEDLERIFESFFTTKRNGMGLGLAIARSAVESNEGRLWVESKIGLGSSFYFTIPVELSTE